MIKEIIKKVCDEYENETQYSKPELMALLSYRVFNMPYFNGQYNFLKLYTDYNDKIKIGTHKSHACDDFYYDFNSMMYESSSSTVNFSMLITVDEREMINNYISKIKLSNNCSELKKVTMDDNDIAIFQRHLNSGTSFQKELDRLFIDTHFKDFQSKKSENSPNYYKMERDIFGNISNRTLRSSMDDSIFFKRAYGSGATFDIAKMKTDGIVNLLKNNYSTLIEILKIDNLNYLVDIDSLNDKKVELLLNDIISDEYLKNNTFIGTCLSIDKFEDRYYKLFDIYKFEEAKEEFFNFYENLLSSDSIESVMDKELKTLNTLENLILLEMPQIKNNNKELKLKEIIISPDSNEHSYIEYINDLLNYNTELVNKDNSYYILDCDRCPAITQYEEEHVSKNEELTQILFSVFDSISGYGYFDSELSVVKDELGIFKSLTVDNYTLSVYLNNDSIYNAFEELFKHCEKNQYVLYLSNKDENESKNNVICNHIIRDLSIKYKDKVVCCITTDNDSSRGDLNIMNEVIYKHYLHKNKVNYNDQIQIATLIKDYLMKNNDDSISIEKKEKIIDLMLKDLKSSTNKLEVKRLPKHKM